MSENVSLFRLYLMRFIYLADFAVLGLSVWPGLIKHQGLDDPLQAVAISFWAALSVLAGLGIRYPLKMVLLLLLQMLYKDIWLIAVWLPLRSAGGSTYLLKPMLIGAVVELIVIPWPYVFGALVKNRGDRWGMGTVRPLVTTQ